MDFFVLHLFFIACLVIFPLPGLRELLSVIGIF